MSDPVPTTVVSKARAAAESFVRTFLQSFIGAVAVINFTTADISGVKIAVLSAASAAVAAGVAAAARVFAPLQTDTQTVGVAGVKS